LCSLWDQRRTPVNPKPTQPLESAADGIAKTLPAEEAPEQNDGAPNDKHDREQDQPPEKPGHQVDKEVSHHSQSVTDTASRKASIFLSSSFR
jgi:hypothetical protein